MNIKDQEVDNMLYYEKQREQIFMPLSQTQAIKAFGVDPDWANKCKKRYLRQQINFYDDLICYLIDNELYDWNTETIYRIVQKINLQDSILKKASDLKKEKNRKITTEEFKLEFIDFLKKQINNMQKQLSFLNPKNKTKYNNNKFDIEKIKQIPIQQILEQRGIEVSTYGFFKIREEKTASAKLYEQSNTYWDFGSSEGGDVIDLVQKLDDCDFKTAYKKLC